MGFWDNGIQDTLTDWQLASLQDAHSVTGNPLFVDANGADNVLGFDATIGNGFDGGPDDNFFVAQLSPAIDSGGVWDGPKTDAFGAIHADDPGSPNIGEQDYTETDLGASLFAEVGVAQGWRSSGSSWLLNLLFDFPFYDVEYSQVRVSSEGMLQIETATFANSGSNSVDELTKFIRIAALWDNLRTDRTGDDIFVDESQAGQVTIRWDASLTTDNNDVNVSITLFNTGAIRFHYGNGNTGLTPTIGISRGNEANYLLSTYDGATDLAIANSVEIAQSASTAIVDMGAYEFRGSRLDITFPTVIATVSAEVLLESVANSLITVLEVHFGEEPNPIDATATANYELREAGVNGLFGDGDDTTIALTPEFTIGSTIVELLIESGPLPQGNYRLSVFGTTTVHDLSSLALDGDSDQTSGGDFVRFFTLVDNVAPSVGVENATVTISEGATTNNSGTVSDPGDTFTLSASIGTVIDNGNGTWSWSFNTTDGPDNTQTVTVTVTDSSDVSTDVDFSLVVNNVVPTLTISGDASVDEGATYTLNLASSDPGADTIQQWTIDWDDTSPPQVVSGNPTSVTHVYAVGPNSHTITATAADEDGTFSANNLAVTVNPNLDPDDALWDGDTNTGNVGNAGDGFLWSDDNNWRVAGFPDQPPQSVAPGDDVIFQTAPTVGTILLGGDRIVNSIVFQADYALDQSINTNTLAITTGDVQVNTGVTATINADIVADSGITKLGDGTLVIDGAAPDVTLDAGTLVLATAGTVQNFTIGSGTTAILNGAVLGDLINNGTIIVAGDLNGDGALNANDIDLLYDQLYRSVPQVHPRFDLIADNVNDQQDVEALVHDIMGREFGDADLDGDIDITDFNSLVVRYDPLGTNTDNGWSNGNFDGDDDIDITDFNYLAVNFSPLGYGRRLDARERVFEQLSSSFARRSF